MEGQTPRLGAVGPSAAIPSQNFTSVIDPDYLKHQAEEGYAAASPGLDPPLITVNAVGGHCRSPAPGGRRKCRRKAGVAGRLRGGSRALSGRFRGAPGRLRGSPGACFGRFLGGLGRSVMAPTASHAIEITEVLARDLVPAALFRPVWRGVDALVAQPDARRRRSRGFGGLVGFTMAKSETRAQFAICRVGCQGTRSIVADRPWGNLATSTSSCHKAPRPCVMDA